MSFYENVIRSVKTGFIKLVSTDTKTHMNFIVGGDEDDWNKSAVTLTVDRVLKVRDALNEAYPPAKAEPEPSEYKVAVTAGNCFYVYREEPSTFRRPLATNLTEANAKKIAQALNEAEGL